MQLGQHTIPETRLFPETIQDVKTVYDSIGADETTSLDLAKILGYSSNTTGAYYKRLTSLTGYGLIEKTGRFRVSELGKRIAYPESDQDKKLAIKDAILRIPLWSELFKKFGKNPPTENFWVQIKNVTGVESPVAQKAESQVRKWYMEDVAQISDDITIEKSSVSDQTKGLSSNKGNNTSMSQILTEISQESYGRFILPNVGFVDVTDEDTLEIAKSYLKVLEKKVKAKKSDIHVQKNQYSEATDNLT